MKAAIFDLDGTLIDSMWLWKNLASNYLTSIDIEPPNDINELIRDYTIYEASVHLKEMFQIVHSPDEINAAIRQILENHYKEVFILKPYVLETLDELKKRNIRMCIATATADDLAITVLKRLGLFEYFEFVQTCDNTGMSKGNPEYFKTAINRLAIDTKDIWVFEDALYCMISAKKCGLNVVAVKEDTAESDITEIKSTADIFIDDFSQLDLDKL